MAKKALVVDNDFFFVEFLVEILEAGGYQVLKAYDGKEGISRLEEEKNIDLLFTDLIIPKIDGKKLIKFARSRFPAADFPIVVLSGVIMEEMDRLEQVPADYFITKGPLEKMSAEIDKVMDKIKSQTFPSPSDEKFFFPTHMVPSQVTDKLIQSADFQRAIIKGIAIGVMVLDHDARILDANPQALEILEKADHEVLNQPVQSIFPEQYGAEIIKVLKDLVVKPYLGKRTFFADMHSMQIRVMVSLLKLDDEIAGWILAMEEKDY
ncbi:MAG: response regulator [Desulfobacterales bacterium]|nr:response regulator [Desulfobacterales bacterium]